MGILFLMTVASSFFLFASFPPLDQGWLAWFGLAPFLYSLRRSTLRESAGLGYLFGCLFLGGGSYFCLRVVPTLSFMLMLLPLAFYYLLFGVLYRWTWRRLGAWQILVAPSLWVALEYLRINMSSFSWPFLLLGFSQHHYLPLIQVADVTGVYGVSFFLVMLNQFLSLAPEMIREHRVKYPVSRPDRSRGNPLTRQFLVMLGVCGLLLAYGWKVSALSEENRFLRVAVIQANVITRDDLTIAEQTANLRAYSSLSLEAAARNPDLIVWPASSLPAPLAFLPVRLTTSALARQVNTYLLVGGSGRPKDSERRDEDPLYANSEFLISPRGVVDGVYHKILLLPFNEYLPLENAIRWPGWITELKQSFTPGREYTLFQVSGARFGTPICWENMFPDLFSRFVADGANFMVSVTNEVFYKGGPGPYQTLAMQVFRAVENRVAIARSAPTGISAFIDPDGRVVATVKDQEGNELDVPGILVRDLPLSFHKTFYTVHGDLFAWVTIGIALTGVFLSAILGEKQTGLQGWGKL